MHIVTLTYTVGLAEIDAAISDHVTWLDENYSDGSFLASGRQEPRVGGVILVAGISRAELDERLSRDPFHQRGLARYAVVTFEASRTAPGAGCADCAVAVGTSRRSETGIGVQANAEPCDHVEA